MKNLGEDVDVEDWNDVVNDVESDVELLKNLKTKNISLKKI